MRASIALARIENARHLERGKNMLIEREPWSPPHDLLAIRSRIDPYPDLGHQIATWISGYLWARDLGVPFAGGVISKDTGGLFDFSHHLASEPPRGHAPARMRVGATGFEYEPWSLPYLRREIDRKAASARRPFIAELALDQRRWDQTEAAAVVRSGFLRGRLGPRLAELEQSSDYVAIHVRRGDIGPETHPDRWLDASHYEQLIERLRRIPRLDAVPVRIYTSGNAADLAQLESMGDVEVRARGDRDTDLLEMAAARVLVTGPSSFGFTAALASQSPVIARHPWWHGVPDRGRWLRYGEGHALDEARLTTLLPPR